MKKNILRGKWGHGVWLNGKRLSPARSQKVYNHSPSGFAWGYGGSGPAQLALAVLLATNGQQYALKNYQKFKWAVIAKQPMPEFKIYFEIPESGLIEETTWGAVV